MTELDAWLFGAAPVILFVGVMWLTSWMEDRSSHCRGPVKDDVA